MNSTLVCLILDPQCDSDGVNCRCVKKSIIPQEVSDAILTYEEVYGVSSFTKRFGIKSGLMDKSSSELYTGLLVEWNTWVSKTDVDDLHSFCKENAYAVLADKLSKYL